MVSRYSPYTHSVFVIQLTDKRHQIKIYLGAHMQVVCDMCYGWWFYSWAWLVWQMTAFSSVANQTWRVSTLLPQPYLHAHPNISTFLPTSMWQIHIYINLPDKPLTLICIPYISECGAMDTSILDLTKATHLNKSDSPFFQMPSSLSKLSVKSWVH